MSNGQCQEKSSKKPLTPAKNGYRVRKYSKEKRSRAPAACFSFRLDPLKFIEKLGPSLRKILNALIGFSLKYGNDNVYPSQSTIARIAGLSREETNRLLRVLEGAGLVTNNYRHNNTSRYKVTTILFMSKVADKCHHLLSALSGLVSQMLTQSINFLSSKFYFNRKSCINNKAHDITSYLCFRSSKSTSKPGTSTWNCPPGVCPKAWRVFVKPEIMAMKRIIEEIAAIVDLTLSGKSKLSIFPTSALSVALRVLTNTLKKRIQIKDPFAFVYASANKECLARGGSPDYTIYDKLKRKHKLTNDDEPLNSNTITFKIESPLKSVRCNRRVPGLYKQKTEHYDKEHELEGFAELEKSEKFKKFRALFGEAGVALLKKSEANILARAT